MTNDGFSRVRLPYEVQLINFMKNVAMAGGLLLLFANGPGAYAVKD